MNGFGWSFYGFFLFAAAWICGVLRVGEVDGEEGDEHRTTRNEQGTNTETANR